MVVSMRVNRSLKAAKTGNSMRKPVESAKSKSFVCRFYQYYIRYEPLKIWIQERPCPGATAIYRFRNSFLESL